MFKQLALAAVVAVASARHHIGRSKRQQAINGYKRFMKDFTFTSEHKHSVSDKYAKQPCEYYFAVVDRPEGTYVIGENDGYCEMNERDGVRLGLWVKSNKIDEIKVAMEGSTDCTVQKGWNGEWSICSFDLIKYRQRNGFLAP